LPQPAAQFEHAAINVDATTKCDTPLGKVDFDFDTDDLMSSITLSAISSTFISKAILFLEEHLFGYDVINAPAEPMLFG
jgi:hypothetical protein